MKEHGQINYKEFEDIPEVEEGLVEGWRVPHNPAPYPQFHHLPNPNIQHDSYIEELQDRADELRLTPPDVPEPLNPKEGRSWLQLLWAKARKAK